MSAAAFAALCPIDAAKANPQTMAAPPVSESPEPPKAPGDASRAALERRVGDFIRAITRNPQSLDDDSLVRWNKPICLLVAGLTADDLKAVTLRVSQISSSAAAPLARAPCQPNFIIVATSDPDGVLNAWYARDHQLFGDATQAQIHQFLEGSQSRPVRVWYNIDRGRKSGMRNGHFIPSSTRAESSVFVGTAISSFFSVFAIIDTRRTQHTTLDQLTDFVALTGLTNVDLDADLGAMPSILRLFAASAGYQPLGLSSWDAAFLRA